MCGVNNGFGYQISRQLQLNPYHDFASGLRDDRPELDSCLRVLRKGDGARGWKLDRHGRNLAHLAHTVQDLAARVVDTPPALPRAWPARNPGWSSLSASGLVEPIRNSPAGTHTNSIPSNTRVRSSALRPGSPSRGGRLDESSMRKSCLRALLEDGQALAAQVLLRGRGPQIGNGFHGLTMEYVFWYFI